MKRYIAILIFSTVGFCSCQKTVVLDLNNAPAQIVIQGEVTDTVGPLTVNINQTVNFYADNIFPGVSDAAVTITDTTVGYTYTLSETSPGVYTTPFATNGYSGDTYKLSVTVNGQTYTALSTMPMPVVFDSINFKSASAFGQTRTNAVVNFQDPAGIKNQYQFIEYINGRQYTKNVFVFDDRLSDGRYITSTLFTDSTYFKKGDILKIKMNCIDNDVYNYFYQLQRSSGNGSFGSSASPANPASNISNGALGYFSACTSQTKEVYVYF